MRGWIKTNNLYIIYVYKSSHLLVNGKLMLMLDMNPSGGYLTNGMDRDGVIVSLVPGGRARRPSVVIHSRRFWREWGLSSSFLSLLSSAPVTQFSNHNHSNNAVHREDLPKYTIPEMKTKTICRYTADENNI